MKVQENCKTGLETNTSPQPDWPTLISLCCPGPNGLNGAAVLWPLMPDSIDELLCQSGQYVISTDEQMDSTIA